ncbi:MAG: cobalamin-dependent protein [Candidatus Omnitrophica bacterium]|nr:cobalamin-dependent protein [Candidatus Omnitrophota bacterium]
MKKIILVRPPRYLWPFINESDNFLLPLGLPCIAAAIKTRLSDVEVKIIDCPPLKIGWQSLGQILQKENPDVVGAGEEALYHHEAVKLFKLAKDINPEVITVAGGHFFSWMVEYSLANFPIDIIVRFEGEETMSELLEALRDKTDLSNIKGIAYRKNGRIFKTSLRPLIEDLDALPLPAYELMPMGKYSPLGYLWPVSATLEHSRGCVDKCNFCSLWTFWGRHIKTDIEKGELEVMPKYRSKSVERTLEEVDIVYKRYNRRYIIWADPTFNIDSKWTDKFCEGLLKRNYKDLYWWAFLRADYLLRDERLGILEKMVRAGLIHPLIGIERACTEDLRKLKKSAYTRKLVKEVFSIFKRKYPQVFRQGTFVTSLPFDTKESMLNLVRYAVEIDIDYPAFHPVAPVPGTCLYQEAKENNLLEEKDLTRYDWSTPIMRSYSGLSRNDFAKLNMELNKRYVLYRPHWLIRGLFSPYKHKRGLYWWFFRNTLRMMLLEIKDAILCRRRFEGATGFMRLRRPKWYDS